VILALDPLRVQRMKVDSVSDIRLTTQDTDRIVGVSTENRSRSQLELPRLKRLHQWRARAVEALRAGQSRCPLERVERPRRGYRRGGEAVSASQ
jgi:DNA-binding PucR family transcriptional regulator